MITRFHAKYYASLLSRHSVGGDIDSLSQSLLSSTVDINPHQIDAALFAFKSPFNKGVVLADEVGLGKTIEAGLVLCQYWSTGKKKSSLYVRLHYVNNGKLSFMTNLVYRARFLTPRISMPTYAMERSI